MSRCDNLEASGLREIQVSSQKVTEVAGVSNESALHYEASDQVDSTHVLVAVQDSGPGLDPRRVEQNALDRDCAAREERAATEAIHRRFTSLTSREREVMARVVGGLLNKQIAAELGTSENTVKTHRHQVMEKMGANSLPELVRMADRLGSLITKS